MAEHQYTGKQKTRKPSAKVEVRERTKAERAFNCTADEVRGLLAGTLRELRREVKPQPRWGNWPHRLGDRTWVCSVGGNQRRCPFGAPGDALWVRETWTPFEFAYESLKPSYLPTSARIVYLADQERRLSGDTYRASTQMPRWASRITLTITDVRVERDGDRWMWVMRVAEPEGGAE